MPTIKHTASAEGLRCFHDHIATRTPSGQCRECIRLGYEYEVRAVKVGRQTRQVVVIPQPEPADDRDSRHDS
jgi:hypothetical protein